MCRRLAIPRNGIFLDFEKIFEMVIWQSEFGVLSFLFHIHQFHIADVRSLVLLQFLYDRSFNLSNFNYVLKLFYRRTAEFLFTDFMTFIQLLKISFHLVSWELNRLTRRLVIIWGRYKTSIRIWVVNVFTGEINLGLKKLS